MGALDVDPTKGRSVPAILSAEFPSLERDGEHVDKLVSFKIMTYVQADMLLSATYASPKEELL